MQEFLLFSGSSHPVFANRIADYLGVRLGKISIQPFPDGETGLQILENVRERDIFIVQSISVNPNTYIMELLIMTDALRRASAANICAVIPYFGYARQDRKDKPRVPVTAKLVANLMTTAGIDRVLTMDLHAGQIQGFFDIPVDNLYGRPVLADKIKQMNLDNLVVLAPDLGAIKIARAYAHQLGAGFGVMDKRRLNAEEVEAMSIIGDVNGKNVLIVDDMSSTAGTLVTAAAACKKAGAKRIFTAFTHGVLIDQARSRIDNSDIELVFTSDSVPDNFARQSPKLTEVSVASIFGDAINRLVKGESISSIFD